MRFCKICNRYTAKDDCGILGQPHALAQYMPNGNRIVRGSEISPELHKQLFPDAAEYQQKKTQ
jgi:hypothetical protein